MNQKKKLMMVMGASVRYSDNRNEVKTKYGLMEGGKYLIPTLFGTNLMIITNIDYDKGVATAENESVQALLSYGKDFRSCWTSSTALNKEAVIRVIVK